MIRDLKISDLTILESSNDIPNLFNGPFKLIRAIEHDGELIGAFWVRVTTESSMIFKDDLSNLTKARTLEEVTKFLYDKVPEQLGISDSFIIFEKDFDPYYVEFLKKHYNFEELPKVLRLRRNDVQ